jgi:Protein of unknown function (DUF1488)
LALNFPNLSRSYDPDHRRVCFWAYDSAMEIPLFLTVNALRRLNPNAGCTEAAMLATFDANRDRINAVADKIHTFDRQDFHILEAGDFS